MVEKKSSGIMSLFRSLEAKENKSWQEVISWCKLIGLKPDEVKKLATGFVFKNKKKQLEINILRDKDNFKHLLSFVDAIKKKSANKLFNQGKGSKELQKFSKIFGYEIPRSRATLSEDLTIIKNAFGIKRIHYGTYKDKKLEEAEKRKAKKDQRLKQLQKSQY